MKRMLAVSTQNGFSLVELMIVITILSILLMMGTALTRSWIDRSQVNNAVANFKIAVNQAKVAALRNTYNQNLDAAAVHLCLDTEKQKLNIIRPSTSTTQTCNLNISSNHLLQSIDLAKGIYIHQANQSFQCLSFNAAGLVISDSAHHCADQDELTFKVGKNDETADLTLM
jgi:type IV pilus assembly protein PilA